MYKSRNIAEGGTPFFERKRGVGIHQHQKRAGKPPAIARGKLSDEKFPFQKKAGGIIFGEGRGEFRFRAWGGEVCVRFAPRVRVFTRKKKFRALSGGPRAPRKKETPRSLTQELHYVIFLQRLRKRHPEESEGGKI